MRFACGFDAPVGEGISVDSPDRFLIWSVLMVETGRVELPVQALSKSYPDLATRI